MTTDSFATTAGASCAWDRPTARLAARARVGVWFMREENGMRQAQPKVRARTIKTITAIGAAGLGISFAAIICALPATARGQIYVADGGVVGTYSFDGTAINA